MKKKRIAIVLPFVGDLSGGGGAERQFSSFFNHYLNSNNPKYELYLITSSSGKNQLQNLGLLGNFDKNIIVLNTTKVKWIKYFLLQPKIIYVVFRYHIDLLHFPMLPFYFLPFLWIFSNLPKLFSPHICLNIIDCGLVHDYFERKYRINVIKNFIRYITHIRIDGIYSWYENFVESFKDIPIKGGPLLFSAKYCFTDVSKYCPSAQKSNLIIFAGRFVDVKNPLMFVRGVSSAIQNNSDLFKEWQFVMFGKGDLKQKVIDEINKHKLSDIVSISYTPDLSSTFSHSKLFISTQNHENFTSLSMLEAMGSGNAIIARNVGQTHMFLKDGINGFFIEPDTEEGLADALIKYVSNLQIHKEMAKQSRNIAMNVHTVNNFTMDIESFWQSVFLLETKKHSL